MARAKDPELLCQVVGALLRSVREERGMKQVAFGRRIGLTGMSVSYFERGMSRMTLPLFIRWCRALNQDPATTLGLAQQITDAREAKAKEKAT